MNYKLIFFIILMCFISADVTAQSQKIQTVVIDAGHGGKDSGSVGKKCKEKDIALYVAKKTGALIKKKYPDIKIIYTRDKDVFVELVGRTRIANRNNADIFISIHCNSNTSSKPHGIETYVLGNEKKYNDQNLDVAKRENASILLENNIEENYGDFDPNSTESYIAFSFIQSEYKQRSLDFAEIIQNELVTTTKLQDRGVRQSHFWVLRGLSMPAVLVELGFISNPTEELFLMKTENQDAMASAIYRAFCTYKKNYENNSVEMQQETVEEEQSQAQTNNAPVVDKNKGVVYKVQFASKSRKVDNAQSVYKSLKDVDYYEHNGMFKYTAGCFATKEEADRYQKEVTSLGYTDAFVVKFEDGVRK